MSGHWAGVVASKPKRVACRSAKGHDVETISLWLVAGLLVLSGLMWAVMFFGPLAHLTHLAGGLTPFDIRPKG
jgi:hypothetical protein